ncbi:hypothetical protein F4810DRAFT_644532, partial [Camillea tinctor]
MHSISLASLYRFLLSISYAILISPYVKKKLYSPALSALFLSFSSPLGIQEKKKAVLNLTSFAFESASPFPLPLILLPSPLLIPPYFFCNTTIATTSIALSS